MTLYTSDTTAQTRAGFRYLIAAVVVAIAGMIYELFSHGVYSNYMIYAFMVPLLCGAVPNLAAAGISIKKERKRSHAAGLQLAAIATLTTGSLLKGALEIYGTTNRLTTVYSVLGITLLAAAMILYVTGRWRR